MIYEKSNFHNFHKLLDFCNLFSPIWDVQSLLKQPVDTCPNRLHLATGKKKRRAYVEESDRNTEANSVDKSRKIEERVLFKNGRLLLCWNRSYTPLNGGEAEVGSAKARDLFYDRFVCQVCVQIYDVSRMKRLHTAGYYQ